MNSMLETLRSTYDGAPESDKLAFEWMIHKLEDLLIEAKRVNYQERFSDQFPRMLFQGVFDAELVAIIDECLEIGKPYEPALEPGCLY